MESFYIFICVGIPIVFTSNFFIVRYLIRKAIKKYVVPNLESKGFIYLDYKWCGLFSHGKFNDETIWSYIGVKGDPRLSIYVNINYEDSGYKKTLTIKINTIFVFIRSIYYSDNNFNLKKNIG